MATTKIEDAPSSLSMHTFAADLSSPVAFEILKLKDSCFIWVGKSEGRSLTDLTVAMQLQESAISSSRLLGNAMIQSTSDWMVKKLCSKLKKLVYLSYNLNTEDNILMKAVEKRLHSEIDAHPECF